LRTLYLSYLAKPASNRPIYRAIRRHKPRKILELGIGFGERAVRMIEAAGRFHPLGEIQFTGVDLFEARSSVDGSGITLKMAHRLLRSTGAAIQLVPGELASGLARVANSLGQVDLIVVSPRLDPNGLARAWFYFPRLMHQQTQVFLEELLPGGRTAVRPLGRNEIDTLAAVTTRRAA
jgi:hypothetical protein